MRKSDFTTSAFPPPLMATGFSPIDQNAKAVAGALW